MIRCNSEKTHLLEAHFSDKADMNDEHQNLGLRLAGDMSQALCMFRKYLLSKTTMNVGKTSSEESLVLKTSRNKSPRPLVPPRFGRSLQRHASLLEQQLLPVFSRCDDEAQSPCHGKPSPGQLTIFYAGAVNVYDNVSADKAQAIMLLAGESSISKPVAIELPKTDMKKPLLRSNSTSAAYNLPDLPIARKKSIQFFLKKRHQRITSKRPYTSPLSAEGNKENEATLGDNSSRDRSISISPFPSRLGYFFSASTNKGR